MATDNHILPDTGFVRLPTVLAHIPIGRSTWFKWIADGKAPRAYKLGIKTSAWKSEDIRAFIAELEKQGGVP